MKLKKLISTITTIAMLTATCAVSPIANAASPDEPVVFTKDFISVNNADAGQTDLIKLEAYTTGSTSHTSTDVPADIVLVLDQSGSMDDPVDDTSNTSKLTIMKQAVDEFVQKVDDYNIGVLEENQHRVAIVGFASEPGSGSNTEILTAMQYNRDTVYEPVADTSTLDTSKIYYIADGGGYDEIKYFNSNYWNEAGWYTYYFENYRNDYVDVATTTVYEQKYVPTTVTSTQGVEYSNLLDINYREALINCTTAETGTGGKLANAIDMLDGNGATRIDYGMEMAANIFAAQPEGTYANRNKIVLVLTDGVPTTSNTFSDTVANAAVATAKTLKAGGAHIFSTYLGTPAANSASFLQAISSNYPTAETYTDLTNQAASSYYSSHTNAADITALFDEIVFNITANSPLDETSVVTDTVSEFFRLPSVIEGVPDPNQIKVYTLDSTGWDAVNEKYTFKDISERVPFENAKVTIGEDKKTVEVTGFNFAYHCVTATAKDGASNYGRKLVIYIPIVVDEGIKTFGGHLPTNNGAAIYHNSESVIPAENKFDDLPMNYIITNEMHSVHLEEGNTYDFNYATQLGAYLDKMIAEGYIPNGTNNAGVTMAYELIDADGSVIATLNIDNAGDIVDVTNPANWDFGANTHLTLTIPAGDDTADNRLTVKCTLTNPETLETYSEDGILGINVVAPTVTKHIVGGIIDDGGTLTPHDPLNPSSFREMVEEGNPNTPLTFNLLEGFEFERIVERTIADDDTPFGAEAILYDITDENNRDTSIFTTDPHDRPMYVWNKDNITDGITVEVYTRPINYTLTTDSIGNAVITDGMTFTHDSDVLNPLRVVAAALTGHKITNITINGTPYDEAALNEAPPPNIIVTKDGSIITGVDVLLPRTSNHTVIVTGEPRTYNVTYHYWEFDNMSSSYVEQARDPHIGVAFGTDIPMPSGTQVGAETPTHILKGWYAVKNGNEFTDITDIENTKMGTRDLEFHSFWEQKPDRVIDITATIEKRLTSTLSDNSAGTITSVGNNTFTFDALFHENVVGSTTITVPDALDNASVTGITATLTEAQRYAWENNGDPIYLVERPDATNTEWTYDTTRYKVVYDATNGYIIKDANDTELTGDVVFTNQHVPYVVSYNLNGGNISGATSIAPRIVQFNDANLLPRDAMMTPLANPTKTNYTFNGWKYNTATVTDTDVYKDLVEDDSAVVSITLDAQFDYNGGGGGGGRTNTAHTLTYESNGGTEYEAEKHRYNTVVKLDKAPKRDGYIFDGWHLDKACEKDATEVRMTSDKTVYANWIEDNGTAGNGHKTPSSLNGDDHFAYIIGYPDDTVRPDANITRAEVTTIFFRLLKDEVRAANLAENNVFDDINADMWYNTAISTMAKLGIVDGRLDNEFFADEYITRAEFATICARFDDGEYTVTDEFTDIEGHWAEDYIHEAAAFGWIRGYDDNTFKPDQYITRAEAMTMVNRVLNRIPENAESLLDDMIKWPDNSDVNAWFYLAVQEATNSHDYEKLNNIYEKWTKLSDVTDWEMYER